MRLHVDGDIIVYRAGFAAEKGLYTLYCYDQEEQYTYKKELDARIGELGLLDGEYIVEFERVAEPVENALHNVKSIVDGVQEVLGTEDVVVYLSGPTNFRDSIATLKKYKGNRDKLHKPVHAQAIKDYIARNYTAVVSVEEEADDRIGISHYQMWKNDPWSSCIVTQDKDLDMIPGLHYNFVKGTAYDVGEYEAIFNFYKQLLTGDTVDNIGGLPGVGHKTAFKILERCDTETEMYDATLHEYEKRFGPKQGFLNLVETAQLLWIRRHEGEIWQPDILDTQANFDSLSPKDESSTTKSAP